MAAKTFTIIKTRRGSESPFTGTIAELVSAFSYTLECGNSWNPRINRNPKTAKALVSALNKSVAETQGSCYDPDHYKLAE
jgi:hypothetical protein